MFRAIDEGRNPRKEGEDSQPQYCLKAILPAVLSTSRHLSNGWGFFLVIFFGFCWVFFLVFS